MSTEIQPTPPPGAMVLVPREPTEAMHVAAVKTLHRCTGNDDFPRRVWRAMLAAAPQPAAQPDTRKPCTCDGAGRGPGRPCVVNAGGRLGDLWRCAEGLEQQPAAQPEPAEPQDDAEQFRAAVLSCADDQWECPMCGHSEPWWRGSNAEHLTKPKPAPAEQPAAQPVNAGLLLTMEEVRQRLGERVPGFGAVLADALCVTMPELFGRIEAGLVTKLDAIEALARAKQQPAAQTAAQVVTIAQGRNAGKQVQMLVDLPNGAKLYTRPIDPQEVMRHAANEWADGLTSALQWLRNIREGISTADEAIANVEQSIEHCRKVDSEARAALARAVGAADA